MQSAELLESTVPVPPQKIFFAEDAVTEGVSTSHGVVQVTRLGDPKNPPMVALSDIALNHRTCYSSFVNYPAMATVLKEVCLYFIDYPGFEDGAATLAGDFPTTTELGTVIDEVLKHYMLDKKLIFLIGVGLGANVAIEYAISHRSTVLGVIVVAFNFGTCSWRDFSYWKQFSYTAYYRPDNTWIYDQLMTRYFSPKTRAENESLLSLYAEEIAKVDKINLSKQIESYIRRPDLTSKVSNLRARVLVFCGRDSYYYDNCVDFFELLDKTNSSFLDFNERAGLLTEEAPYVFAEPIKYFFQGFGLAIPPLPTRRRDSDDDDEDDDDEDVVENEDEEESDSDSDEADGEKSGKAAKATDKSEQANSPSEKNAAGALLLG